jgi:hypothetical protein
MFRRVFDVSDRCDHIEEPAIIDPANVSFGEGGFPVSEQAPCDEEKVVVALQLW